LDLSEQKELFSLDAAEYLYTIVGTNYAEQENELLREALNYLNAEGRQVKGPLVGRYLASSHKDGQDYYEVWLAITS